VPLLLEIHKQLDLDVEKPRCQTGKERYKYYNYICKLTINISNFLEEKQLQSHVILGLGGENQKDEKCKN
jgi:hypothetical protein